MILKYICSITYYKINRQVFTQRLSYKRLLRISPPGVLQKLKEFTEHHDFTKSLELLQEIGITGENALSAIASIQNQEVA